VWFAINLIQRKSRKRQRRNCGSISKFSRPTEENHVKPHDNACLRRDSRHSLHEYDLESSPLSLCLIHNGWYLIFTVVPKSSTVQPSAAIPCTASFDTQEICILPTECVCVLRRVSQPKQLISLTTDWLFDGVGICPPWGRMWISVSYIKFALQRASLTHLNSLLTKEFFFLATYPVQLILPDSITLMVLREMKTISNNASVYTLICVC
jgi:hypothetical protein